VKLVLLLATFFNLFVEKTNKDKCVESGEQFEERWNVSNRTGMVRWGQPRHLPIGFIGVAVLFFHGSTASSGPRTAYF
jgi:hypothetical protein